MTEPASSMDIALQDLSYRLAKLEHTVLLLARHVGATGWNKPLQSRLDAIEADLAHLGEEVMRA